MGAPKEWTASVWYVSPDVGVAVGVAIGVAVGVALGGVDVRRESIVELIPESTVWSPSWFISSIVSSLSFPLPSTSIVSSVLESTMTGGGDNSPPLRLLLALPSPLNGLLSTLTIVQLSSEPGISLSVH